MGQLIEENGGKYSVEMVKGECTHLIVAAPQGEKYKHAKMWGIHVSSFDIFCWILGERNVHVIKVLCW